MKSEEEPIADDEVLLRRVYYDRFPTNHNNEFSPRTFEPRTKGDNRDVDGISLYRLDCLGSADDVLKHLDEEKRSKNGLVGFRAGKLRALGFNFVSKPTDIPGHIVVPELNSVDYEKQKSCLTPKLVDVAKLASAAGSIVVYPTFQP
jgi:hypothetical protein